MEEPSTPFPQPRLFGSRYPPTIEAHQEPRSCQIYVVPSVITWPQIWTRCRYTSWTVYSNEQETQVCRRFASSSGNRPRLVAPYSLPCKHTTPVWISMLKIKCAQIKRRQVEAVGRPYNKVNETSWFPSTAS